MLCFELLLWSMGEGNVFTGARHSVHRGECIHDVPPDPPLRMHPPEGRRSTGGRYASYWKILDELFLNNILHSFNDMRELII